MRYATLSLFPLLIATAAASEFAAKLEPFLEFHCYECHADGAKKGGLEFEKLGTDLSDPATFAKWEQVFLRVKSGEMPPKKVDVRPTEKETAETIALLSPELNAAHLANKATVLRRLNRNEYENTMNDIFGTRLELSELLPADGRSHEFDNVGKFLGVSMTHLKGYLEAARTVIKTATEKQLIAPKSILVQGAIAEAKLNEFMGKNWFTLPDGALVRFEGDTYPHGTYENTGVTVPGYYDIKVTGYEYQTKKPIICSISAFTWSGPPEGDVFHYAAFPPGEPTTIRLRRWLKVGEMVKVEPQGLFLSWPRPENLMTHDGPGFATKSVTVEGPFFDEFPSAGYKLIFDGMNRTLVEPGNPADKYTEWYRPEFNTITDDENATALSAIRRVAEKAWRRPVTDSELPVYLDLFKQERAAGAIFDESLYQAITALFVSPKFIYLSENQGELDSYQLASRLSYFLTRSLPDSQLRGLADRGELATNLVTQAERLLSSQGYERFIEDFTDAWLDLRKMNDTSPDTALFPEYDQFLHNSLVEETRAFVSELIRGNLPVKNIVKSDFAMLNDRLAVHYGLPEVDGPAIRKVALPADSVRGGVMTQGSVLKVTANGTNTSPVMRGVWTLERIFGTPPQPPPPGTPGIEPDTRGAKTLRDILALHRTSVTCAGCHAKIDPPGFALESFDPVGGFRDRFRNNSEGENAAKFVKGQWANYKLGLPVDSTGELPDGRKFSSFREFRDLLASDEPQLAKNFATKLLTFATGREMGFSDLPEIEHIVTITARNGYRAGDILKAVVTSKIFQTK